MVQQGFELLVDVRLKGGVGRENCITDCVTPCDGYDSRPGSSIIQLDPGCVDLSRSDVFPPLSHHPARRMTAD